MMLNCLDVTATDEARGSGLKILKPKSCPCTMTMAFLVRRERA